MFTNSIKPVPKWRKRTEIAPRSPFMPLSRYYPQHPIILTPTTKDELCFFLCLTETKTYNGPSFCLWLTFSPSRWWNSSTFLYVVSYWFLLLWASCSTLWLFHHVFIQGAVDGRLDPLQRLTLVNTGAANLPEHAVCWACAHSSVAALLEMAFLARGVGMGSA